MLLIGFTTSRGPPSIKAKVKQDLQPEVFHTVGQIACAGRRAGLTSEKSGFVRTLTCSCVGSLIAIAFRTRMYEGQDVRALQS